MGQSKTTTNRWKKGERLEIEFSSYRTGRYPRITQDSEEDGIVASALATSNGPTLFTIKNQIEKGKRFYIQDLKRGDVISLCTSHEIYNEGCRRYLYWDQAVINGKTHLIFLTLISYDRNGIGKSPYWFMEAIGFEFQEGSHKVSCRFASWSQAVDIQPKHDYIYGVTAEKVTINDLNTLERFMSHLAKYHQDIVEYLCGLNKRPASFLDKAARDATYRDTALKLTNQWASIVCPELGCQLIQNLRDKFPEDDSEEFHRYFPIPDNRSMNHKDRVRPLKDLCKCLTGKVTAFKSSIL
ncbi:hypothetical protein FGRMN_9061 [Fusarium graminum]|nr:hypothetical protein FGRMN_9061 [Fusarium graminum]